MPDSIFVGDAEYTPTESNLELSEIFADIPDDLFDIPDDDELEFDDETLYEITPKGLRVLDDALGEEYQADFDQREAEWAARFAEETDQRYETIQRWYDECRQAREENIELNGIITEFVRLFEIIAAYPSQSTKIAQDALALVVKVDGEERE